MGDICKCKQYFLDSFQLTNNIDNAAKGFFTNRDTNGGSGINDFLTTDKTFCTIHSNGSDGILSQMLGYLKDQPGGAASNVQGVENFGKAIFKLYVDNGTNNGNNLAFVGLCCGNFIGISTAGFFMKQNQKKILSYSIDHHHLNKVADQRYTSQATFYYLLLY